MKNSSRLFLCVLGVLCVFAAPGCGYSLAGHGSFLPVYIKTIGIPTFVYHLLHQAAEEGVHCENLRRIVLGGEKVSDGLRQKLRDLALELAVAESNQGYANSNVGINLELANYRTVEYTSAGDGHFTDEDRFSDPSDGYMDDIHASRDANAADVSVLIINDAGNCGLAHSIGSTAATAFATVHYDCATGYYSFAHEIGHLLSARHDPAAVRNLVFLPSAVGEHEIAGVPSRMA